MTDDVIGDLKGSRSHHEKGSIYTVHKGIGEVHSSNPDRVPHFRDGSLSGLHAARPEAEFLERGQWKPLDAFE